MLVAFFVILVSLRFPFEKQGVNDIPLYLNVQPYLTNDTLDLYNETALLESNKIYKNYNLTINILPQVNLNFSFNDSDKTLIFTQNCTYIEELYNKILRRLRAGKDRFGTYKRKVSRAPAARVGDS